MNMHKRLKGLILALSLTLLVSACQNSSTTEQTSSLEVTKLTQETTIEETSERTSKTSSETTEESTETTADEVAAKPEFDRAGNAIDLPDEINRIASLAGSNTEVLVELGVADKIVAIDTFSTAIEGVSSDVLAIDMMSPDIESLMALNLDLILASNISDAGGEDSIFKQLIDLGVTVAYIPTSNSVQEIQEDILFLGAVLDLSTEANALADEFMNGLDELKEIAKTIPEEEQKTVFVEISALPYIYSTGQGTFLHEIIELVGAKNVLAHEEAWLPVEEESAISLNPDVILTNINYIEDPVAEILGRAGWENVTAVANGAVYQIDNSWSSLPNHNVLKAAVEIAKAVYPDYYGE